MSTVFSAYDIRGRAGDTLTKEHAWNAGKAFSEWLPDPGPVIVYKNTSVNLDIYNSFIEGLLLMGRDVVDAGEGRKDDVVNALGDEKIVGGAMVVHDQAYDVEVISLFDANGAEITDKNGLTEVSQLVDAGQMIPAREKGSIITRD